MTKIIIQLDIRIGYKFYNLLLGFTVADWDTNQQYQGLIHDTTLSPPTVDRGDYYDKVTKSSTWINGDK